MAGLPKMELTGNQEFSMEHHRGLLEYADQQIAIGSSAGTVRLYGKGLVIKLMNQERITVSGTIQTVELEESQHE